MAAPTTSQEFLDLVLKSGVVDEKRLQAYVQQKGASLPGDVQQLAQTMVHDGLLTYFQAGQFLQGRFRKFSIGNYRVLERLGSGAMAHVYLCEHTTLRKRVAIKVLPNALAEDQNYLKRFYREARASATVDHPNIVKAFDVDQDDKLHFMVMEYVDGVLLEDLVKQVGPLPWLRAAHYIRQAAAGLQHAHEANLVHRDIKPENLVVDRGGTVKILDMGLARFFNEGDELLTRGILGTPDYLAPEQSLDSHSVDIRADIYSLGGSFYYLLTGSQPFAEGTLAQKLLWHQTRYPKPIKSFRQDVPDELIAVVDKMMAKNPAERYQTPAEVVQALEPFTRTPVPPPAESELPRLCPALLGHEPRGGTPAIPKPQAPLLKKAPVPPLEQTPRPPLAPARAPQPAAVAAMTGPPTPPPVKKNPAASRPRPEPTAADTDARPAKTLADPEPIDPNAALQAALRQPVLAPAPTAPAAKKTNLRWLILVVVLAAVLGFLGVAAWKLLWPAGTKSAAPPPPAAAVRTS
jgi:serine/threonine protein kinase